MRILVTALPFFFIKRTKKICTTLEEKTAVTRKKKKEADKKAHRGFCLKALVGPLEALEHGPVSGDNHLCAKKAQKIRVVFL